MNEIGHTHVEEFAYPFLVRIEQLEEALDDFRRSVLEHLPIPLFRIRTKIEDNRVIIIGDVFHNPNKWINLLEDISLVGDATFDTNVEFGYFELRSNIFRGVRTLTADWALGFFREFHKYIEKFGIPPNYLEIKSVDHRHRDSGKYAHPSEIREKIAVEFRLAQGNRYPPTKTQYAKEWGICTKTINNYLKEFPGSET